MRLLAWAAYGLALTAISWPLPYLFITSGLDESWQIALALATRADVTFGDDLVFTYGPLGIYLLPSPIYGDTLVLSVATVTALGIVLAIVLTRGARHWLGLAGGALAAYVTLGLMLGSTPESLTFLAAAGGAALLITPPERERTTLLLAAAAGVLSAVAILGKLNAGVGAAALLAIALAGLGRSGLLARLAVFAASLAVTFVALWLATGQALSDIAPWVRGATEIAAGYTAAMNLVPTELEWSYLAAGALAAGVLVLAHQRGRDLPVQRRRALLAMFALFLFVAFKQAFVRLDASHTWVYFAMTLALIVATPWRTDQRWRALGLGFFALILALAISTRAPGAYFSPAWHVERYVDRLEQILPASERGELVARTQGLVTSQLGLDPALLALTDGYTVHIEPWETSAIWAYQMRWAPLPVFQSYYAYTPYLDQRNAERLASAEAPQRILRIQDQTIDGRFQPHEAPRAFVAMVCHYQQMRVIGIWQLLGIVPPRCEGERPLGEVDVEKGEEARVPRARPGEMVVAHVDIPVSPWERVRTLFFKPRWRPYEVLDGTPYRLVVATAGGPLVMRMPRTVGWDERFYGDLDIDTLGFQSVPGAVHVRFAAIPVSPE